jgi:hypothetical protein
MKIHTHGNRMKFDGTVNGRWTSAPVDVRVEKANSTDFSSLYSRLLYSTITPKFAPLA